MKQQDEKGSDKKINNRGESRESNPGPRAP